MKWRRKITRKVFRLISLMLLSFFSGILFSLNVFSNSLDFEENVVLEIPKPYFKVRDFLFIERITFYNPVVWQTDATPQVSSCGPNLEKQVALSRDIFFNDQGEKHLCGTKVDIITEDGVIFKDYVVNDTMNPRFENTVDIMLPKTRIDEAFNLGIKQGTIIFHD